MAQQLHTLVIKSKQFPTFMWCLTTIPNFQFQGLLHSPSKPAGTRQTCGAHTYTKHPYTENKLNTPKMQMIAIIRYFVT